MSGLIPGRECGSCTVCCTSLVIDEPGFKKISDAPCSHLKSGGACGIYETRFPICRQWFCAWRSAGFLDDWWRPDRCGVLVYVTGSNLPVRFAAARGGLTFTLLKGPDVIEDDHFIEIVAMLIERGVAVFLSVPGAPGYESGKAFLNDGMAASVHSHERARLVADLKTAYAAAIAQPRNKIALDPEG